MHYQVDCIYHFWAPMQRGARGSANRPTPLFASHLWDPLQLTISFCNIFRDPVRLGKLLRQATPLDTWEGATWKRLRTSVFHTHTHRCRRRGLMDSLKRFKRLPLSRSAHRAISGRCSELSHTSPPDHWLKFILGSKAKERKWTLKREKRRALMPLLGASSLT